MESKGHIAEHDEVDENVIKLFKHKECNLYKLKLKTIDIEYIINYLKNNTIYSFSIFKTDLCDNDFINLFSSLSNQKYLNFLSIRQTNISISTLIHCLSNLNPEIEIRDITLEINSDNDIEYTDYIKILKSINIKKKIKHIFFLDNKFAYADIYYLGTHISCHEEEYLTRFGDIKFKSSKQYKLL